MFFLILLDLYRFLLLEATFFLLGDIQEACPPSIKQVSYVSALFLPQLYVLWTIQKKLGISIPTELRVIWENDKRESERERVCQFIPA